MNRRSFITGMAGILASGIAPAAIGSGVLMPARKIITASPLVLNRIIIRSDGLYFPPGVYYEKEVQEAMNQLMTKREMVRFFGGVQWRS